MKKQIVWIVLLVALACAAVSPAAAQAGFSAEDQALIDFVQAAFDQFLTLDSFTSEGTTNITQHMNLTMQDIDMEIEQVIEQVISGQATRDSDGQLSMAVKVDQFISQATSGQPAQDITQTVEVMIVDGELYMRFSNLSPDTMAGMFPSGWMNLSRDADAFPGAEMINPDQYTNLLSSQFTYPLDENTVERVKELPGETVNGTETRVIQIVFNGPALFSSGEMDQYLSAFSTAQMGLDMDQLRQNMGENAAMEMTVWIGVDDGMIYQTDVVMSLAGEMGAVIAYVEDMYLEQEATTSVMFSGFNEPVTIEAPEVE